MIDTSKPVGLVALDCCWKSAELKGKVNLDYDIETHRRHLKKSQSLGSLFCQEGRFVTENDRDDRAEQSYPSDPPERDNQVVPDTNKCHEGSLPSLYPDTSWPMSLQLLSDHLENGSVLSAKDPIYSHEHPENSDSFGDCRFQFDNYGSHKPRGVFKSHSMPNIVDLTHASGGSSCFNQHSTPQGRSSINLQVLLVHSKENSGHKVETKVTEDHCQDDSICESENVNTKDDFVDNCCDSYCYSLSKDRIIPVTDELNLVTALRRESSRPQLDEPHDKDFMTRRVEEWVNDLQHCSMLVEADESSNNNDCRQRKSAISDTLIATKVDVKESPGMEAVKKYISSLNALSTTAHLANQGLVVIPFLSAFVGLRVLNLSGNAIVRITAGALPRGLHMLNLSRNNISTIEGLRELTRLRVLDLSYNRILRIGYGLASCSSLKELYLAGNKISEVEGLHRLLKLALLDLCFNKLSTAKCLGQLAANYNSLVAISLEGNPAQRNVGDEQLKKCLLGLLPHLAYFNRQPIRSSSLKDVTDRSLRLGISMHQLDRSLRLDPRGSRKSNHGTSAYKPSSFGSLHSDTGHLVGSLKRSKDRHGYLHPTGVRASIAHQNRYLDNSLKPSSLRAEVSMRRSRSQGTFGPV